VTSAINYLSINENFPVAGQDNDTQTFRDNFDTIKTNFRSAQEEVTDLQLYTAKTNGDNDFNNNEISKTVLRNTMFKKFDGGIITLPTTQLTVDYENGGYQVFRFAANMNIDFQNLPQNSSASGPIGCGKVTLELYGDGSTRTLSFLTSAGTEFRRNSSFPGTITVTSMTAPIIIDVWRHNAAYIFMHYHGQYS
jgi:hypothetical protein